MFHHMYNKDSILYCREISFKLLRSEMSIRSGILIKLGIYIAIRQCCAILSFALMFQEAHRNIVNDIPLSL